MIQEPDGPDSNPDIDRRVRAIAKDLFKSCNDLRSESTTQSDSEDISPLYHSIAEITQRYQSHELIGQGGMKEVYRVYDAKMARHVALAKPLSGHLSDRFDAFLREAHLTARLEHPGVIEVLNIGIDDQDRPFFTMELKKGRSLRDLVKEVRENIDEKRPPIRGRLEIFMRICEAIAYAHSRRVLHLDIKPSNIQIGEFGEVQVCDWGLGVVMPDEDSTGISTALLDPDLYGPLLIHTKGTPAYMAPEQMDPLRPKRPQMDIYALGCMLYELIVGKKYRSGQRQQNIVSGLSAIIKKAVADDPANRYESVTELSADLSLFLSDYSTSVEKRNPFREALLFWKRHREACAVVLGACVLLAGFLGSFIYQLSAKEQVAVAARAKSEVAEREAKEAELETKDLLIKYQTKFAESEELLTELRASHKELRASHEELEKLQHNAQRFYAIQGSPKVVQQSIDHFRKQVASENAPPDSRALEYLCWWYLVDQDFKAASELANVEHGVGIPSHLSGVSRVFAPLLNADDYLATKDLLALTKRLESRDLLVDRILIHDLQHPRSIEERVQLVQQRVTLNNPGQNGIELEYSQENRRIRLRGPVRKLRFYFDLGAPQGYHGNFLNSLDPLDLDLRGTRVSVNQLLGLQPTKIDIRGTPPSNLTVLRKFRSLQQLIVDEGQFSKRQLAKVPAWTKVVIVPKEAEEMDSKEEGRANVGF